MFMFSPFHVKNKPTSVLYVLQHVFCVQNNLEKGLPNSNKNDLECQGSVITECHFKVTPLKTSTIKEQDSNNK